MNIFELFDSYEEALSKITVDEETGEVIGTEAIDELSGNIDEKLENIACAIKNLTAETNELKLAEQSLAERRKAKEKKTEWLKGYLAEAMNKLERPMFETAKCKLSFRASTKVIIDNEELIPGDYKITKTEISVDKKALTTALKNSEIAGCHLEHSQNLQIK